MKKYDRKSVKSLSTFEFGGQIENWSSSPTLAMCRISDVNRNQLAVYTNLSTCATPAEFDVNRPGRDGPPPVGPPPVPEPLAVVTSFAYSSAACRSCRSVVFVFVESVSYHLVGIEAETRNPKTTPKIKQSNV